MCPSPEPPPPPVVLPCPGSADAQAPRSLFFDVGTNDGGSLVSFLLKRGLMREDGAVPLVHMESGLRDRPKWHVVAVEANPRWAPILRAKCASYVAAGITASCEVVSAALTTFDGNATLHFDTPGGSLGASILAESNSVRSKGLSAQVPAMDVLTLFKQLPPRRQDNCVVKVDIEGAEYDVLQRAIANGLVALWDELYVEWHAKSGFVLGGTRAGEKAACTQKSLVEAFRTVAVTHPPGWYLEAKPWE